MKKTFVLFVLLFTLIVFIGCSSEEKRDFTGIIKNAYIENAVFFGLSGESDRYCDITLKIEYTEESLGKTGIIEIFNKDGEKMYNTIFTVDEDLKEGYIYREKASFLQNVDPNKPKAQTAKVVLKINGEIVGTAKFNDVDATFYGE